MALTLLGLGDYCAFTRVLLCHLATSLNVPLHVLADTERRISMALAKIVENITPEELQARRFEEGKYRSRGRPRPQHDSDALTNANLFAHNNRPATANIGDHVDGLAAPLVSAGLSTVFGGLGVPPAAAATMLQGMTESTVVVGTLFGLYGSRATAKMTESYAKDIQDFGLLPVNGKEGRTAMIDPKDVPPDDRRLRLTICIPGFLDPNLEGGDNCKSPFKVLGDATEVYTYQWETEVLFKTGAALDKLLKAPGWSEVKKDIHFRSGEYQHVPVIRSSHHVSHQHLSGQVELTINVNQEHSYTVNQHSNLACRFDSPEQDHRQRVGQLTRKG